MARRKYRVESIALLETDAAFGATGVNLVSDNVGIGIHFNTFVDIDAPNLEAFKQTKYKYGVVERRTIERDVEGWEDLFLAGRMQNRTNE